MNSDENESMISTYAERYLDSISAPDISQPFSLITFSGVPGSGKTTLATKLAKDLSAYHVHQDDIRHMIRMSDDDPKNYVISDIAKLVVESILKSSQNKRIILDSSIDRTWKKLLSDLGPHNVTPFIIRMDASRDEIGRRLSERDGVDHVHIRNLDVFFDEYLECQRQLPADIEIQGDYSYKDVLGRIRKDLRFSS